MSATHSVADHRHAAILEWLRAPFISHQIIMDGAEAWIIDQIIDNRAPHTALEQGIAFHIVGIDVAVDQDVVGIIMDERAL